MTIINKYASARQIGKLDGEVVKPFIENRATEERVVEGLDPLSGALKRNYLFFTQQDGALYVLAVYLRVFKVRNIYSISTR